MTDHVRVAGVSGGTDGISARYDDMLSVGQVLAAASRDLLTLALDCHRYAGAVEASSILDPQGAARYEAALVAALQGAGGLTVVAGDIGIDGARLVAAVAAYRTVDRLDRDAADLRRFAQGYVAGATAPVWLPVGAAGAGRWYAETRASGRDPAAEAEKLLVQHPDAVDEFVGSAPGALNGLDDLSGGMLGWFHQLRTGQAALPQSVTDAAAGIGLYYDDGKAAVTPLGAASGPTAAEVPDGLAAVVDGLARRGAGKPGEVDVRTLTYVAPDGSLRRSHIVNLPGTRETKPPGAHADVVNDMGTNFRAISGQQTTYENGVDEALRLAGVTAGEPVMLVGHSQGGIVAVNAARRFVTAGTYNVQAVVTAGSPVARLDVPDSVQVLSLENRFDLIPRLDAADNPDRHNWTTVTLDSQQLSVGANHSLVTTYRPGAELLDSGMAASVAQWAAGVEGTFVFSRGQPATAATNVYGIRRSK